MSIEKEPPLAEEDVPPPADEDFYEKTTFETKPAYRFQLIMQPFDFGRFASRKPRPQPQANEKPIPNFPKFKALRDSLEGVENKLDDRSI